MQAHAALMLHFQPSAHPPACAFYANAMQAQKHKEEHRVPTRDRPALTADAFQLGQTYGVGVGCVSVRQL